MSAQIEGSQGAAGTAPSTSQPAEPSATGRTYSTPEGWTQVLFVEVGTGADGHGQNSTKAAVRACRNAIEFNSIACIEKFVPNSYQGMKLHVKIGCPHPEMIDIEAVRKVFPYGTPVFEVVEGGLCCSSRVAIEALGDRSDDMYVAVAAVTVGY